MWPLQRATCNTCFVRADLGYDLSLSATPAAAPQYDQAAPTQAQQQAQAVQQQQQQQGSHAGAHAQQAALQGQQYMPQQANQNGMYGAYGGSMDPADDLDLIVDSGAPYASTFVAGAGAQGQGSVADDVRCYLRCCACYCLVLCRADCDVAHIGWLCNKAVEVRFAFDLQAFTRQHAAGVGSLSLGAFISELA